MSCISYWVTERDREQCYAVKKGSQRASGDLIGWQNSDDLDLPGFFHTSREFPRTPLFIHGSPVMRLDACMQAYRLALIGIGSGRVTLWDAQYYTRCGECCRCRST